MPFLHAQVVRHSMQGSLRYIYVRELPSVFCMTAQECNARLCQWVDVRLKPKIMGVFVENEDSVLSKIREEIPLSKYFLDTPFACDYDHHYREYIRDNPAEAGFGVGVWNVISGGQGVRNYIQSLMTSIQDKIPQEIQVRLLAILRTNVEAGKERINQLITQEIKTSDPSIEVHEVLDALSTAFTHVATVESLDWQVADLLRRFGLLGLIIALIFSLGDLLTKAGDTVTFTQDGIQDRAKQQCWDKLTRALASSEVKSELDKADSKNLEEFTKILERQGNLACLAVEQAVLSTLYAVDCPIFDESVISAASSGTPRSPSGRSSSWTPRGRREANGC